jgi:Skp family chaperone for outer membrane proteins
MTARHWLGTGAVLTATAALAVLVGRHWQNGQSGRSPGSVAVIDLDDIARRLGSDKQMADSINQRQSALRQQLVDLSKRYSEQIAERKKTQPAAAQAEKGEVTLAAFEQQANASFNQMKQRAEVDLQSHRAQLIAQFRDQIKPAARRVAQARGLSVIVTKNDTVVFDYTGASDITDAVVEELLAAHAPHTAAVAPAAPTAAQ